MNAATKPGFPLPAAKHYMVLWALPAEFGGMTTMSLHRAGAFREYGATAAPVITFEPKPSYTGTLQRLQEQGKISPETEVLNVFQHYRKADLAGRRSTAEQTVPKDSGPLGLSEVVLDPSGAVFMRETKRPDGTTTASRRFYREDGSEFLRDESPTDAQGKSLGRFLTLLDPGGIPVGRWRSAGSFYRSWLSELAGSDRTVFIVDSAYTTAIVAPLQQDNIMKIAVMHNSHVAGGKDPFQGKIGSGRKTVVENTDAWDGIVFLTRKNQQDFEDRFGTSSNLFTVSNPTPRAPSLPPFSERRSNRGVMVCRLEPQKNVAAALDIMALVHRSLPECSLDIYGTGALRDELQARAADLRLQDIVTFHGHAPAAAREFDTARFSLLTSRNEGQGLVLMESIGRGCPPVAYDIRYGPAEVIDHGETGYLVPPGDTATAAGHVIRLCTDDGLARRMGELGWQRSERFSDKTIVGHWAKVLNQAWQQQHSRLVLSDLDFKLKEISFAASGELDILGDLTWRQSAGPPAENVLTAHVLIARRSEGKPLFVPAGITQRAPGLLKIHARVTPAELDKDVPDANNELDLNLQIQGANVLHAFRIGFPGTVPWRPYATVHGSLSLKFV